MNTNDGIFTQPGPDGIFGRGGEPLDASNPVIDANDQNLRETLVAVWQAPGHMRVARATRNIKTGGVEQHEDYREPTERERAILVSQGVTAPVQVATQLGAIPSPAQLSGDTPAPAGAAADAKKPGQPWMKLGVAVAVGAAGFWAFGKWVVPYLEARKAAGDDEPEPETDDEE